MSWTQMKQLEPVGRAMAEVQASGLFDGAREVVVARAPGRLDVMGGIADYTGSVVCELPLDVAAVAVVQGRDDGKVVCQSGQAAAVVTLSMQALREATDGAALRTLMDGDDKWARYVAGCVWWLGATHDRWPEGGVTLLVESDVPLGGGVSSSAAIEVATMTAMAELLGVKLEPMALAAACQQVENRVVGAPCGVMDQVTSCLGEADALLELLCQPDAAGLPAQLRRSLKVPGGYAFVGIHSGVSHDVSGDPYTDTRVAAFMAQKMLEERGLGGGGFLANVSPDAYRNVQRQLPDAMTGQAFIDAHGGTNDDVTTIVPERSYHVRAAADHHVFECQRVQAFIAALVAADYGDTPDQMRRAGDLMIDSHHSYGRNAKLGHAHVDRLVELVEDLGPSRGLFGAKITGGGCGGTVAVLIEDTAAARAAINEIRQAYEKETGHRTTLFDGSGPGAAQLGAVRTKLNA